MSKCKVCREKFDQKYYYCSKSCQEKDWPAHKQIHKRLQAEQSSGAAQHEVPKQINETELMRAAYAGDFKRVSRLLKDGVDPLVRTDQNITCIHHAIFGGHPRIVELLASHTPELMYYVPSPTGEVETCLHLACALGKLQIVKALVHAGGHTLIMGQTPRGNATHSCLMRACDNERHDVVEYLVKVGGDELLNFTRCDGRTCLHIASQSRDPTAIKIILRKVPPPLIHKHMTDGCSCLVIACERGNSEVARCLLAAGGRRLLLAAVDTGSTCLHAACRAGCAETAALLLDADGGEELLFRKCLSGFTCLHSASIRGNPDVLRLLLARGGEALLFAREDSGRTCLHTACQSLQCPLDSIRLLAEAGGSRLMQATAVTNGTILSTCDFAALSGRRDVLEYVTGIGGGQPDEKTDAFLELSPMLQRRARRGARRKQDPGTLTGSEEKDDAAGGGVAVEPEPPQRGAAAAARGGSRGGSGAM